MKNHLKWSAFSAAAVAASLVPASIRAVPEAGCNFMHNYLYDSWFDPADHYVHNGGLPLSSKYEYLGYHYVSTWHSGTVDGLSWDHDLGCQGG